MAMEIYPSYEYMLASRPSRPQEAESKPIIEKRKGKKK